MSDDTHRLNEDEGSLAGDALVRAVREDLLNLFGLVKGVDQKVEALDHKVETLDHKVETLDQKVETLDQKFEALDEKVEALDKRVDTLDAKVEARLRDTTPMWEVVVSRLDAIVAEQESHGRRLDGIEGTLDAVKGKIERLVAIETEIRQLRRRIERMIGELSHDVVEVRAAQHDLEDRLEKLEKTP